MNRSLPIVAAVLLLVGLVVVDSAGAIELPLRSYSSTGYGWHGNYYNAAWGTPVALVVPPTARSYVSYGWGVGGTRVTPIHSQFQRNWPGPATYDPQRFRPTPPWPSDTDQFGIYYIRGPW